MDTAYEIIQLDRNKWQGYPLLFFYVSQNYYDAAITRKDDGFFISFTKKPFDKPYEHSPYEHGPDGTDKLFQPWWEDIKAWGIEDGDRLLAAIETAVEKWTNRLIVTELWVDEKHRRKGIATALMDTAVKRARNEKRRAVILETQSCNEGAIAFYERYGFSLIGFDACAYGNNDIGRKEVRLDMGLTIE